MSATGLAVGSSARSYGQILGDNDRLNFAISGLNSRAYAHLSSLKANKANARISHVCDVESNILKKFAASTQQEMGVALRPIRTFAIAVPSENGRWDEPNIDTGGEFTG